MKIDPSILLKAAEIFDLDLSQLHPLGGMEGMALAFKRENRGYVLKVTPMGNNIAKLQNEIEAKSEFVTYLAENGARVAKPVRSPTGSWLAIVETRDRDYYVTAATRAEGKHVDLNDPQTSSPSFFQAWGKTTGQLHRIAKTYPHWKKLPQSGASASAITDWQEEHDHFKNWCQDDAVREKWVELHPPISELPQERERYGLIHNDLHPWNFLVDHNGDITVIDFDVCAYHFFIKDIAIALFFANWIGNPGIGRSKDEYLTCFLQNFLKGYALENDLPGDWLRQLPLLLRHHLILLFIVFTDDWKSPNTWQANTLQRWRRQILTDAPVLKILA